jgi:hypothetical protein
MAARNIGAAARISAATLAGILLVGEAASAATTPAHARYTYVFPLKVGAGNRILVDQKEVPFLMVGDAPQAMVGNLSPQDAAYFIADRAQYGINALWVNLLCDSYTACNADGSTFDGIAPFTTPGDLSTPNPRYFNRAAEMISLAAAKGMVVFLDPIETGGWLGTLESNGITKASAYGRYVGQRFRDFTNIVWMSGNDFQSWQNSTDNALVAAVAQGIHGADPNRLQTIELNYYVSASLDDPAWRNIAGIDAVYTYRPTYAKELGEYNRLTFKPTFLVEANYEFEQNGGTDGGSTQNLRHQEYWTALSGTTGQLYGSHYSWTLTGDWKSNLDSIGIHQLSLMRQLFASLDWYDLVPDRQHQVLVKGYGTFSQTDSIDTDTYATAAATPNGMLAIAYMPNLRTVTIDMAKFAGPVTAQWFDPTNAAITTIKGSPFPNSGTQAFVAPGVNGGGDGDWVLLLRG